MPRLFTGLEVPPDIAQQLTLYRGGLAGARWVEPSDYHVTLRFFGDIDNAAADDVHAGLQDLRPRGPITLTLAGLSEFGGNKPRAIFAAVSPDPALTELQAEHERVARRADLPPEGRKFTPHITLARLKRSASATDVARYLAQVGVFPRVSFTVERVALFSARESQGGGPYIVEAAYPLDDPGAV